MTKRPKRLEVFDEDTLKDLAALQNPSIRGRGTSAGISTRSRSAKVPSIYYVSTMGEGGGLIKKTNFAYILSWLNLRKVSLWLQTPKKVPNHSTEQLLFRWL